MALSFDEAYAIISRIGKEIGQLYKRGDKLAKDVFDRYSDWYKHEHAAYVAAKGTGQVLPDNRRRRAVVSALETYLHRDLTVHERNELAGKKGHLVETDAKVPSNIIQLEVARAVRRH